MRLTRSDGAWWRACLLLAAIWLTCESGGSRRAWASAGTRLPAICWTRAAAARLLVGALCSAGRADGHRRRARSQRGSCGSLVALWAALHDIGKITPEFQACDPDARLPGYPPGRGQRLRHDHGRAWLAVRRCCRIWATRPATRCLLAQLLGGHHGTFHPVMPGVPAGAPLSVLRLQRGCVGGAAAGRVRGCAGGTRGAGAAAEAGSAGGRAGLRDHHPCGLAGQPGIPSAVTAWRGSRVRFCRGAACPFRAGRWWPLRP